MTQIAGVAILFSKYLDYELCEKSIDDNERLIVVKIKIGKNILSFVIYIYAITRYNKQEQINFINLIKEKMVPFEGESTYFNFYMHPKLDKLDIMSNKWDNPIYRKKHFSSRSF